MNTDDEQHLGHFDVITLEQLRGSGMEIVEFLTKKQIGLVKDDADAGGYVLTTEPLTEITVRTTVYAGPGFACPDCNLTSYHPDDAKHRYCGACHKFF